VGVAAGLGQDRIQLFDHHRRRRQVPVNPLSLSGRLTRTARLSTLSTSTLVADPLCLLIGEGVCVHKGGGGEVTSEGLALGGDLLADRTVEGGRVGCGVGWGGVGWRWGGGGWRWRWKWGRVKRGKVDGA
jgi:hypothetical protein